MVAAAAAAAWLKGRWITGLFVFLFKCLFCMRPGSLPSILTSGSAVWLQISPHGLQTINVLVRSDLCQNKNIAEITGKIA